MSHKTILLVEDDRAIREMTKTLLELEGYRVNCAANGKEGIDCLRSRGRPDLILLDMMMPIVNGWGFLDVIKENPIMADVPVVIVSAYKEIAASVKPDAYIPKPIELNLLLKTIEELAA